jgi:Arc/MetJ-type ribon-helix-helix transcriptional regulator
MSPHMERITVRTPAVLLTEMEECVRDGSYAHDSEFVREAIREKVEREQDDRRRQRPTRMRGGGSP